MSVQLSLPRLTLLERRRFQHTLNVMLPTPLDIKNSSFSSYVCTPTMSVTFPSSPTQDTNSSRFLQSCLLSVCLSVCLCVCVWKGLSLLNYISFYRIYSFAVGLSPFKVSRFSMMCWVVIGFSTHCLRFINELR